ncbi:MAG TPA: hypothetical protein PLJ29_05030 [Leptospiraceae bacterium]|nr:hypothetical protein [Leptospiraceae bacterium]HMY66766.1 hypothetical protein [Leptospiraceae bacterium]HNI25701.1 hypothetical protein [Leptospiraceae bacterium]HNI96276.1 hypothetical protein [Leptospiraceae bacterium]HNM02156.1 hypothetical protein [Leptospiraceae bacterium]
MRVRKFFPVLFIILLPFPAADLRSEDNKYFDYIYVNANTGQSSGGHTAVRIGDLVYHFQFYPDEIFHFVRESWKSFLFVYGSLDSRSIFLKRVRVSEKTYSFLSDELNRFYLTRTMQISLYEVLKRDLEMAELAEQADAVFPLKGAGYFQKKTGTAEGLGKLRRYLNDIRSVQFGKVFLDESKIPVHTDRNAFYRLRTGYSESVIAETAFREIEKIISEDSVLKEGAFFERKLHDPERKRRVLNNYKIFKSAVLAGLDRLVRERDGRNWYRILASLSRFLVLEKSISENRILVLKTFPETADYYAKNKKDAETEIVSTRKILERFADSAEIQFTSAENPDEMDYSLYEDSCNREENFNDSEKVRLSFERMYPSLSENRKIRQEYRTDENRRKAFREALLSYENTLRTLYPFDLIRENCTTEIWNLLISVSEKEADVLSELLREGERMERSRFDFVPFYSYEVFGKKMKSVKKASYESYRKRYVSGLKTGAKFKEDFTLFSSVYRYSSQDSFFLMFTDDTVLLRPLYGILNLSAGTLYSAGAVFYAPFDRAKRLKKGGESLLFSLPELIFFNIRKGTFISAEDYDRIFFGEDFGTEETDS